MSDWRSDFRRAGVVFLAGMGMFGLMCALAPAAKIVSSELRTECKELLAQPEPDYVAFTCDVVDATGIAVQTFAVKAPQKSAPAFRAAHVHKVDAGP